MKSENVGSEWTDIKKGMVIAPDTYVDIRGFLRSAKDHSYVVWHYKNCPVTGLNEDTIVVDSETGAPWCPQCLQKKRLIAHYRG